MKRLLLFLPVLISLASCGEKQNRKPVPDTITDSAGKKQVLSKKEPACFYSSPQQVTMEFLSSGKDDTLCWCDSMPSFYMKKLQASYLANRYAVVLFDEDSVIRVYREEAKGWMLYDSVYDWIGFFGPCHSVSWIDLNGDNYCDVKIWHSSSVHGNEWCTLLLTDTVHHSFVLEKTFTSVDSPVYDKKRKVLQSQSVSGAFGTEYHELYKWKNNQLFPYRQFIIDGSSGQYIYSHGVGKNWKEDWRKVSSGNKFKYPKLLNEDLPYDSTCDCLNH